METGYSRSSAAIKILEMVHLFLQGSLPNLEFLACLSLYCLPGTAFSSSLIFLNILKISLILIGQISVQSKSKCSSTSSFPGFSSLVTVSSFSLGALVMSHREPSFCSLEFLCASGSRKPMHIG